MRMQTDGEKAGKADKFQWYVGEARAAGSIPLTSTATSRMETEISDTRSHCSVCHRLLTVVRSAHYLDKAFHIDVVARIIPQ